MIGQLLGDKPITAAGAKEGDAIIMTKGLAIEGTAIIACERQRDLVGRLPVRLLRRARDLLQSPGLSVGVEAAIAVRCGAHALHDPTEGGLVNGLWELAQASQLSLHIDANRVPVYPESQALCDQFGLDPLRLLASGALLIACPQRATKKLCRELDAADIMSSVIGSVSAGSAGVHFKDGRTVKSVATDEILKIFDEV